MTWVFLALLAIGVLAAIWIRIWRRWIEPWREVEELVDAITNNRPPRKFPAHSQPIAHRSVSR